MDIQEYANVIKDVCVLMKISTPSTTLIRNVTHYCKQLNYARVVKQYPDKDQRYEFIAQSYLISIRDQSLKFDYTEYLRNQHKQDIKEDAIAAGGAIAPITEWLGSRMPTIASKSMSIYIDSSMRDISMGSTSSNITDFAFTLIPRQSRISANSGQIQTRVMPSQITYFKVGRMILPYALSLRSRNYSKEITLTFTALRSNGIIAHNETYHFAFTYNILNDNLVELVPINEYCKFSPPLRLIDDLSIRFNDPVYPIEFPIDVIQPSQYIYINTDGRIVFDTPHGLATGSVVVVLGLTASGTTASNAALLATVNDPRGHVITKISDNIIAINVDLTTMTSPDVSAVPSLQVLSRTFRFPLEVGYQDITELH